MKEEERRGLFRASSSFLHKFPQLHSQIAPAHPFCNDKHQPETVTLFLPYNLNHSHLHVRNETDNPSNFSLNNSHNVLEIKLVKINTPTILHTFRLLNSKLFPVSYNESFYKNVLNIHSDLSRVTMISDRCIGAISCREEPYLNRGRILFYYSLYNDTRCR
jgi:hypothetical protein